MPEMGQEKKSRNTQKFPKNWSTENIHTSEYSNDKKPVQQNHMGGHCRSKKKPEDQNVGIFGHCQHSRGSVWPELRVTWKALGLWNEKMFWLILQLNCKPWSLSTAIRQSIYFQPHSLTPRKELLEYSLNSQTMSLVTEDVTVTRSCSGFPSALWPLWSLSKEFTWDTQSMG